MKKSRMLGVWGASLLFVFFSAAEAATIEQIKAVSGSSNTLAFSGFNSSLGTLTGVNFHYDLNVFLEGQCDAVPLDCAASGELVIVGSGPASGLSIFEDLPTLDIPFGNSNSQITNHSDTRPFSSPSSFVDAVGIDISVNTSAFGTVGAVLSSNALVDSGSVTLEYIYTAAVPVPAAIWLFGSGLLGLVGVTRRKKA